MIRLYIYHAERCNVKKCTGCKLARYRYAIPVKKFDKILRGTILLNPYTDKSISKEDREIALKYGLASVDCSWENAEKIFSKLEKRRRLRHRALPYLLAVNPINYGKPFKLTTLEAFSAALYIMGFKYDAEQILKIYSWAQHFLEMNREPLNCYSSVETSMEVVKIQHDFM